MATTKSNGAATTAPAPASVPLETVKQVLVKLAEPFPPELVKQREGWRDNSGNVHMVNYIEWHAVADRLDDVCPEWSHEITQIQTTPDGGGLLVVAAITVCGIKREGLGCGAVDSETGVKKAEHDALKRAAIKFGIGRELYRKDDAPGGEWQQRPGGMPTNPAAHNPADLITPKQIVLVKRLCDEIGVDIDAELFNTTKSDIPLEEISKRAASAFIDHLKNLTPTHGGQDEPHHETAPGAFVETDRTRAMGEISHIAKDHGIARNVATFTAFLNGLVGVDSLEQVNNQAVFAARDTLAQAVNTPRYLTWNAGSWICSEGTKALSMGLIAAVAKSEGWDKVNMIVGDPSIHTNKNILKMNANLCSFLGREKQLAALEAQYKNAPGR